MDPIQNIKAVVRQMRFTGDAFATTGNDHMYKNMYLLAEYLDRAVEAIEEENKTLELIKQKWKESRSEDGRLCEGSFVDSIAEFMK